MNIERYFDVIYNALSVAFLLALAVAVIRGLLLGRPRTANPDRWHGRGAAIAAFGTGLALAGGLVADNFLQDNALFQQVRFGIYFIGFALVVLGTMFIIRAAVASRAGAFRRLPAVVLVLFVISLAVSIPFLCIPSTFVLNQNHEQVQLAVYWLPLLVPSASGAIALFITAAGSGSRARVILVGLFEALLFLGLLRESEILPDLGDPLVNLSVSFIPFVLGGIAVAIGAGMRRPIA
jgi:hypothetical protein